MPVFHLNWAFLFVLLAVVNYLCKSDNIKIIKMTTLIAQFDDAAKLEEADTLLNQLNIPFNSEASDESNPDNIVWDWSDVDDVAFSNFAISQIADDWNSEADQFWDTL
jgi:hypothetical protein